MIIKKIREILNTRLYTPLYITPAKLRGSPRANLICIAFPLPSRVHAQFAYAHSCVIIALACAFPRMSSRIHKALYTVAGHFYRAGPRFKNRKRKPRRTYVEISRQMTRLFWVTLTARSSSDSTLGLFRVTKFNN